MAAAASKSSKSKTLTPEQALARVESVAKATRLDGVAVEARQNGKRHVVTITDENGTRVLAYVDPKTRGKGFAVEVAHYGGYERVKADDVAAAARAVKTSKRRYPRKLKTQPKSK